MKLPKFIKLIIYSTIILFIAVTIIGLLLPPVTRVSRTKDIEMPADSIRRYIFQLEEWKQWIPGADSAAIKILAYDDTQRVKSMIMGSFTITVQNRTDSSFITTWNSTENPEQTSTLTLYPHTDGKSATVNWLFEQPVKWYPWERLSTMMFEKIFGIPMEMGLEKLKAVCEKRPSS